MLHRGSALLPLTLATTLGSACASTENPPPPQRPNQAAEPSEPGAPRDQPASSTTPLYPQIVLDVDNLWADEGEDWSIVVHVDGSFERAHTWSDGASDFVTTCTGTLPRDQVDPWLARIRTEATHGREVGSPQQKDPSSGLVFTVQYVVDAQTRTGIDHRPWLADLEAWFSVLSRAEGECSERPL